MKKENRNPDDRARYIKVMDCMDMNYFTTVFNKLVSDWQKNFKDDRKRPSIRTLAPLLDVSNTTVGDWMRGKTSDIQYKHFKKICDFFDVDPEVFSPNYVFLFPDYSLEQIKALDAKCNKLKIDKNLLFFIKDNYTIPHVLSDDPYVSNPTLRPPAPKNAASDFVVSSGEKRSFMDEKDLDLVLELQNRIKALTEEFLTERAIAFEQDFMKWATGVEQDGDPGSESYDNHVQWIIDQCPHLDPKAIKKACKQTYIDNKKKAKKSK